MKDRQSPRTRASVCVRTASGVVRVKRTVASQMVSEGKGEYCPKSEYKANRK